MPGSHEQYLLNFEIDLLKIVIIHFQQELDYGLNKNNEIISHSNSDCGRHQHSCHRLFFRMGPSETDPSDAADDSPLIEVYYEGLLSKYKEAKFLKTGYWICAILLSTALLILLHLI